jgi:hypothetical protein
LAFPEKDDVEEGIYINNNVLYYIILYLIYTYILLYIATATCTPPCLKSSTSNNNNGNNSNAQKMDIVIRNKKKYAKVINGLYSEIKTYQQSLKTLKEQLQTKDIKILEINASREKLVEGILYNIYIVCIYISYI